MHQPPKGTQDFLPEEMITRNYIFDTVKRIYEKWGYEPIETPAFEEWKLLSKKSGGGQSIKDEIYYFKDKSKRELGLRFDLTVPMARVVASNPQLPKPFKRYHIGRVWRYDKPGAGRRREFWQTDADIIGSSSLEADAEVIAVACECLQTLGFKDFTVRLNNRKILENFIKSIKIKNHIEVFRSIDKLDKIGQKGVEKELIKKKFSKEQINKILKFINNEKFSSVIFEELIEKIKILGYEKKIKIDLSLVRGLEYYTGSVFEIVTKNSKSSIAGGGRYDKLIETFGGKPTPATGISLGIERIFQLIKKQKKPITQIYIANVNDDVKKDVIKLAKKFRELGINTEYDLMNRNLRKQLDYVNSKKIPYVIVIGNKEIKTKKLKLRNMQTGKEVFIEEGKIERIFDFI